MNSRTPLRVTALCVALAITSPAHGQVECWAPGMTSPVTLTESTRHRSVSFTRPYRYDVFGVAGRLQLGNHANNASVVDNRFRLKLLGLIGTGNPVDSTAYVRLQTSLLGYYPEDISVTGGSPGVAVGPMHRYGPSWTLCDPRNPRDVGFTFHLAGSSLLGSLLAPAHYNLNPSGYFYVLGEYHSAPPVMTGKLTIAGTSALHGSAVPVSFRIDRAAQRPVYRPPFLGLDLGDANLTVLGTPPTSPSAPPSSPSVVLGGYPAVDLVNVTLDLNDSHGTGWVKISRTP